MVFRAVDIVFQHLKPLIALLVAIPLAVGLFGFVFMHTELVSARVWANQPLLTLDFTSNLNPESQSPAQSESALMLELIGTDAFAAGVEKVVQPGFDTWSSTAQEQAMADLRAAFSVDPAGEHIFVMSYTTNQPAYGITVLQAIVRNYGIAVVDLESSQVEAVSGALKANLTVAQQAMNQAVSTAEGYQAQHHLSAQDAQGDPNYGTLLGQARSRTDSYLRLLALVDAAQASQQAVITVPASMFHVIDSPALVPDPLLSARTPGLKQAGVTLAIVALLEALLVYVIARRDPTVRSGEEIRRALGLKPLGSVPSLGPS